MAFVPEPREKTKKSKAERKRERKIQRRSRDGLADLVENEDALEGFAALEVDAPVTALEELSSYDKVVDKRVDDSSAVTPIRKTANGTNEPGLDDVKTPGRARRSPRKITMVAERRERKGPMESLAGIIEEENDLEEFTAMRMNATVTILGESTASSGGKGRKRVAKSPAAMPFSEMTNNFDAIFMNDDGPELDDLKTPAKRPRRSPRKITMVANANDDEKEEREVEDWVLASPSKARAKA